MQHAHASPCILHRRDIVAIRVRVCVCFIVAALYAYDTSNYFGTWNYIRPYSYYCSGSETSLDSCSNDLAYHYWHNCDGPYDDEAGVRCTGPFGEVCSQEGDVRLVGGNDENEGILEYCAFGSWSPFCSLGDEEATVACKQLGHFYYTCEFSSFMMNH